MTPAEWRQKFLQDPDRLIQEMQKKYWQNSEGIKFPPRLRASLIQSLTEYDICRGADSVRALVRVVLHGTWDDSVGKMLAFQIACAGESDNGIFELTLFDQVKSQLSSRKRMSPFTHNILINWFGALAQDESFARLGATQVLKTLMKKRG
jgi:hypothetical protein